MREEHPDFHWINDLEELKNHQIDYVINLAGESIGQGRWTAARKKLLDSRLNTTKQLYDYQKNQIKPKRIISTSAIATTESIRKNAGIRCTKVRHNPYTEMGKPLITKIVRFAVMFGQGGGILPQMLLPIAEYVWPDSGVSR